MARAQRAKRERLQGQNGLFGVVVDDGTPEEVPGPRGWSVTELLAAEKTALGFYITGHPLENYVDVLQGLKAAKSIELSTLRSGARISIGGIISDFNRGQQRRAIVLRFCVSRMKAAEPNACSGQNLSQAFCLVQNEAAVLITGRLE